MKAEGHPALNNVCFLDIGTGRRFLTKSTMKSARKEQIDGQEYFVIARDVTMDSHPAYTGEPRREVHHEVQARRREEVILARLLFQISKPSGNGGLFFCPLRKRSERRVEAAGAIADQKIMPA